MMAWSCDACKVIWTRNGGGRTTAEEMTHFETIINMEPEAKEAEILDILRNENLCEGITEEFPQQAEDQVQEEQDSDLKRPCFKSTPRLASPAKRIKRLPFTDISSYAFDPVLYANALPLLKESDKRYNHDGTITFITGLLPYPARPNTYPGNGVVHHTVSGTTVPQWAECMQNYLERNQIRGDRPYIKRLLLPELKKCYRDFVPSWWRTSLHVPTGLCNKCGGNDHFGASCWTRTAVRDGLEAELCHYCPWEVVREHTHTFYVCKEAHTLCRQCREYGHGLSMPCPKGTSARRADAARWERFKMHEMETSKPQFKRRPMDFLADFAEDYEFVFGGFGGDMVDYMKDVNAGFLCRIYHRRSGNDSMPPRKHARPAWMTRFRCSRPTRRR
jgi:hypothetical protein